MIVDGAGKKALLLRTQVHEGESLDSFLTRLAALNKLRSVSDLLASAVPKPELYSAQWFQAMSSLTGSSSSSLVEASPLSLACKTLHPKVELMALEVNGAIYRVPRPDSLPLLKKQLTRQTQLQFCPDCLRERAYHRLHWYPALNRYCMVHRALLVSRCPGCKHHLEMDSVVKSRCQICGTFLPSAPTAYLADDSPAHQAQLLLNSWWLTAPLAPELLDRTLPTDNVRVLLTLTAGLAKVVRRLESGPLSFHRSAWDIPETFQFDADLLETVADFDRVTTAVLAISHWPNSFVEFLDHVRARSGRGDPRHKIRGDFPYLYSDYLEHEWLFPEFHSVQSAFEDFLVANYQYRRSVEGARRYREDPSFRARFEYISMHEAARRMGVSIDEIELLIKQRALGYQFRHHYPTEVGYWLIPEFVDYLANEYQNSFEVSEAAAFFCISEEVIQQLVELGLLERDPAPKDSSSTRLTGRSVWRFRYQFQSAQQRFDGPEMAIEEASKYLAHRGWDSARVLKAVLDGQLRCRYGGVNISLACLSREDVFGLMKQTAREYLNELARPIAARFGVDTSRVLIWHQLGLLTEDKTTNGLRNVNEEDLMCFQERYILYGEAPNVLGIHPGSLQTWVNSGRYREVGFSEYGAHSGLFLRADIERFAAGRTLTPTDITRVYGIGETRLNFWVASEALKPISGPGVDNCTHHRFAVEDVEQLVHDTRALSNNSRP